MRLQRGVPTFRGIGTKSDYLVSILELDANEHSDQTDTTLSHRSPVCQHICLENSQLGSPAARYNLL